MSKLELGAAMHAADAARREDPDAGHVGRLHRRRDGRAGDGRSNSAAPRRRVARPWRPPCPVSASRSRSAGSSPTRKCPSMIAIGRGRRAACADDRFDPPSPSRGSAGSGMPCVMMVDSSATTAPPGAEGGAHLSGDRQRSSTGHAAALRAHGLLRRAQAGQRQGPRTIGPGERLVPTGDLALGSAAIQPLDLAGHSAEYDGSWSGPTAGPRRRPAEGTSPCRAVSRRADPAACRHRHTPIPIASRRSMTRCGGSAFVHPRAPAGVPQRQGDAS